MTLVNYSGFEPLHVVVLQVQSVGSQNAVIFIVNLLDDFKFEVVCLIMIKLLTCEECVRLPGLHQGDDALLGHHRVSHSVAASLHSSRGSRGLSQLGLRIEVNLRVGSHLNLLSLV